MGLAAGLTKVENVVSDLTQALKQLAARQDDYALYADYYAGRHRLAFATDKFRNAFGALFRAFADNLCPAVLDAVVDRLIVTGFQLDSGTTDPASRVPALLPSPTTPEPADLTADVAADRATATGMKPADLAWDLWLANRMPRRAGEVHLEAETEGDAFVVVWPDPDTGLPIIDPQMTGVCTVAYDPERRGRVRWGAKVWQLPDGVMRATLYYPDRIEKYATAQPVQAAPRDDRAFVAYHVPGEAWPLPNPYEVVPVFHFACNTKTGSPGRSDLADVIPLQDALNKAVCDMLVGMEFNAFPQRWVTGLEVELDEASGRPLAPFVPGEDRVWAVGDKEVKFGEFPAASLDNYLHVQDNLRFEIARVTRTPLHYMALSSGQRAPSGEALRIAEAPLVHKITDRAGAYGEVWGDVLSLALRMVGVIATVTPEWQDPLPKSQLELSEELTALQGLGVPNEVLQKLWGFTDAEIAAMHQIVQAHAQEHAALQAQAASVGGPPGE